MRTNVFILLAFLLCVLNVEAQRNKTQEVVEIEISGVVTDQNGNPIPGAIIVQKDNEIKGCISDIDGKFVVKLPQKATIQVSYVGFETVEQKLSADKTNYDIVLNEESKEINEIVVIGYGEIKKSDLTGSVSTIGSRHFGDQPVKSVSEILQGRTSGVEVTTVSGMPGATAKIRVRGTTSINKSSDPL